MVRERSGVRPSAAAPFSQRKTNTCKIAETGQSGSVRNITGTNGPKTWGIRTKPVQGAAVCAGSVLSYSHGQEKARWSDASHNEVAGLKLRPVVTTRPETMAKSRLYISLARAADILGETVDEITKWRRDPALGFPRSYSFDRPAEHGRPAIKRGPFFRHDEVQRWQQRQGDSGSRERPPDEETAAPAAGWHGGIDESHADSFTHLGTEKQGTPCSKCKLYDSANLRVLHRQRATLGRDCDVLVRPLTGRKWSGCWLSATRDPGAHCHFFQSRRGRAADG